MKGGVWSAAFALARLYTRHSPVDRGKSRLMDLTRLQVLPRVPRDRPVILASEDGRRFVLELHDPATYNLMMLGTYDPRETALLRRLVRPGDVALDIGANDGWYTTLLAAIVGPRGRVHAFEPVPGTCRRLRAACEINGLDTRVVFNAFGLAESPGSATIYVPEHRGGASLRLLEEARGAPFACRLSTLDDYCRALRVEDIRVIKCDVEGGEMGILRGASGVLAGPQRPMWLLELNRVTTRRFGYEPEDLLALLEGHGYVPHLLNREPPGTLRPMTDRSAFEDCENVLCSVPSIHGNVARLADARNTRVA